MLFQILVILVTSWRTSWLCCHAFPTRSCMHFWIRLLCFSIVNCSSPASSKNWCFNKSRVCLEFGGPLTFPYRPLNLRYLSPLLKYIYVADVRTLQLSYSQSKKTICRRWRRYAIGHPLFFRWYKLCEFTCKRSKNKKRKCVNMLTHSIHGT